MQQTLLLIIGTIILLLGIPIGSLLAKYTKEELKQGRIWFKRIILFCLIGIIISLIFSNDVLLFTFSFIAIVTSQSLRK